MNKATTAPESAEPLKFKNAALLNRLFEMTKAPYYATACDTLVLAEMAIVGLERENAALRAEVERLADQAAQPVKWRNGCENTAPAALRFLAEHERPAGGQQDYNSEHLYQIADEIEATHRDAQPPAQAEPATAPVGEYPAKALEGVEPVACLVETEQGVMVWPIADLGEASTYCDEGEFPELLYPAATVSALQARIAELEQDAARYRWLRANVEPVFARKHSEEFHDLNMKWQIKAYLTAVTAVGGDVPFDESIDAARKESK